MTGSVSLDVTAKRFLMVAHAIFSLGCVLQVLGLILYGPQSTLFLEGLALSLFALYVSLFEGAVLLAYRRLHFSMKIQTVISESSIFFHLLFLGLTHGVTYEFLAGPISG